MPKYPGAIPHGTPKEAPFRLVHVDAYFRDPAWGKRCRCGSPPDFLELRHLRNVPTPRGQIDMWDWEPACAMCVTLPDESMRTWARQKAAEKRGYHEAVAESAKARPQPASGGGDIWARPDMEGEGEIASPRASQALTGGI